ncbi:hypothetical protein PFLU3_16150 [Pseudomonas fluorescens]|uniref:Uncharacterized protein n=1 Tax=Pseudomonas fluorescens TaxID=294 RepID=A0A0D0RTL5_PSEFL|nr:hypothetical protein C4K02_3005 [Pseudomonas synxantha]KIR22932.1 hypothetical protein PFLU3_16150 [Pseudomonas fluorescens]
MDQSALNKLATYVQTLDVAKLIEANYLDMLLAEEEEDPYAELYEDIC